MEKYKALVIYTVSDDNSRMEFERELEKYGLEWFEGQTVYGLPLEEYRTKVQPFKAYLREFSRKLMEPSDTVLFMESRMSPERDLTTMLQTNLMTEDE